MTLRQNDVLLAPMAGVTDRAFREICLEYGVDMCFSEMVSAKGLYYNDKKTAQLLEHSESNTPFYAQIFGHEPQIFNSVIDKILKYNVNGIDINCGCPAKKILTNSDGGAILKNPSLIYDLIKSVKDKTDLPVSVKIRIGWDDNDINYLKSVEFANKAGASHITIHGRTVKQEYSGQSNWESIKIAVSNSSIPIVGNGDIKSPIDAKEMLDKTKCHAIMVGRGILGNPFLFKSIKEYLKTDELLTQPNNADKIETALKHICKIIEYKGETIGIKEARKHAIWYIKGMKDSVKIKNLITCAKTYAEMENLLTSLI